MTRVLHTQADLIKVSSGRSRTPLLALQTNANSGCCSKSTALMGVKHFSNTRVQNVRGSQNPATGRCNWEVTLPFHAWTWRRGYHNFQPHFQTLLGFMPHFFISRIFYGLSKKSIETQLLELLLFNVGHWV